MMQTSHPLGVEDHDAFTARMHEVLATYVSAATARWPEALASELRTRDPSFPMDGLAAHPPPPRLLEVSCALRLPDGQTALSVYAHENAELSEDERDALLAFQEPLPGLVYEVKALRGLCLRVLDGARRRTIDVRTPPKPFPLEVFIAPGALLLCKLAPLRDFFTHLGPLQVIRAEDRSLLAESLQRQLADQVESGEEPVVRFLGVSGFASAGRN